MTARHFAQTGVEDGPDDATAKAQALAGRHFRADAVEALVPAPAESPFRVPVEEDADADAAARDYVDQMLRELEEQMARPKARHARAAGTPASGDAHGIGTSGEEAPAAGQDVPDAGVDAVPSLVADTQPEGQATVASALPDPEAEPDEVPAGQVAVAEGLDATLVLDRVVAALAESGPVASDEQLAPEAPRERLEVSTDYVQSLQDIPLKSNSLAIARPEPRRPFGFFARIGAFVSRLLRLDER